MGGGITKLNSNAFTLIELLAIIVILAIIAVITVPIILNIIENSRKGAATDSAYGYKDSVNKAYITELQNHNKLKLNDTYTVTNGTLSDGDFGDEEITSLSISVSGTIPSSGSLIYSNNVLTEGWLVIGDYRVTFNQDGTVTTVKNTGSNNNQNNNGGTTVADITVANYGTYVDLGTNLLDLENTTLSDNTHPAADWRVFYKDAGGVWLILADYLPVESGTIGSSVVSNVGLETYNTYGVYSNVSRTDLISRLNGNWNSLIEGSDVLGETGILVKGAVDLPTWVASWNQNADYTHLYYENITEPDNNTYYAAGYIISDTEPIETFAISVDNDDTLYFPHETDINECVAYWLASLSAWDDIWVMNAGTYSIGYEIYDTSSEYYIGIRPIVYLPSNVLLDITETVWTIAD